MTYEDLVNIFKNAANAYTGTPSLNFHYDAVWYNNGEASNQYPSMLFERSPDFELVGQQSNGRTGKQTFKGKLFFYDTFWENERAVKDVYVKPISYIEFPSLEVEPPRPVFETLRPIMEKPKIVFEKPKPSFEKPTPFIEKPRPPIERPRPFFEKPKPVVERPKPIVEPPRIVRRRKEKPREKLRKPVPKRGYSFEVRRKGKWERAKLPYAFATEEGAEAFAQKKVLKEAAASYKVVKAKKGKKVVRTGAKISPYDRVLFREGKEQGVKVQKKLLRILSEGEKKEISYAGGIAKMKKAETSFFKQPAKKKTTKNKVIKKKKGGIK